MEAIALTTHDLEIEDVEYLRHGDTPLLLRLFKPSGTGPFPLIVQLHGGAWCRGDRSNDTVINEPLAQSGVMVAALDWRMPPVASYPAALADINYAVRWLKARAGDLRSRPELFGLLGNSSGGHQAMLAAMRPRDSRYSALPLPADAAQVDARVRCVIMCCPVIDPLGRYHYAKDLKNAADRRLSLPTGFCRATINSGGLKKRWRKEAPHSRSNAESGLSCRLCSIFKAPPTWRIRNPIANASLRVIAKPAAISSWNCSKAKPRASSVEMRNHLTPHARWRKSSTSCIDSSVERPTLEQ